MILESSMYRILDIQQQCTITQNIYYTQFNSRTSANNFHHKYNYKSDKQHQL